MSRTPSPPASRPPQAAASQIAGKLQRAVEHHQRGQLAEAEALYREILGYAPRHFDALHLIGIASIQRGHPEAAVESINKAVEAEPQNPNLAAALSNLGIALSALKRPEAALAAFERALSLNAGNVDACYNRASALLALRRHEEALSDLDAVLALRPAHPEALNNRGNALLALQRPGDALASFDRALALKPAFAEALNNRAIALLALQRPEDALANAERAVALNPAFAEALSTRGNALLALKRYAEAAKAFTQLVRLAPDYENALGNLVDCHLRSCDWTALAETSKRLEDAVAAGKQAALPFAFLGVSASARAQQQCARTFIASKSPASPAPLAAGERYRHDRIRIAYVSADFHEHATAYLMAGLFEAHDKTRFEITAVSFGPDTRDAMRDRLSRAFDAFVDVRGTSDRGVAQLLRAKEIDIAVDLKGFSANSRTGIFSHRPAPIQVNYLGYPGTLGAEYFDYIVADRYVIPSESDIFYTEKVVRLPDSYQVNDYRRAIAQWLPGRAELGLPESGFVFCCFNSNYKITPEVFDVWMRLLNRLPGSVLWLLETSGDASANLRREARERGVAPDRLIFAPPMTLDRHLARHRCADLFVDTQPVNAHTTASDALWAGLPLVTCVDDAFASRVAMSLLNAVGLPELVARDLAEYEALALKLATTPSLLHELRARLATHRTSAPLFDTDRSRRHLESAYVAMWERCQRGEPPESFDVAPIS